MYAHMTKWSICGCKYQRLYAIPTLQGDPQPDYTLVALDNCKFPSLTELTEVILPWDSGEHNQVILDDDRYIIHEAFLSTVVDTVPPKPTPPLPVVPNTGLLSADLLTYDARLSLIYHDSLKLVIKYSPAKLFTLIRNKGLWPKLLTRSISAPKSCWDFFDNFNYADAMTRSFPWVDHGSSFIPYSGYEFWSLSSVDSWTGLR